MSVDYSNQLQTNYELRSALLTAKLAINTSKQIEVYLTDQLASEHRARLSAESQVEQLKGKKSGFWKGAGTGAGLILILSLFIK